MTKYHHIITKYHHIMTKYHHIMTKYHHIMTKYHHITTKYHHIMKHLIIRQLWRSIEDIKQTLTILFLYNAEVRCVLQLRHLSNRTKSGSVTRKSRISNRKKSYLFMFLPIGRYKPWMVGEGVLDSWGKVKRRSQCLTCTKSYDLKGVKRFGNKKLYLIVFQLQMPCQNACKTLYPNSCLQLQSWGPTKYLLLSKPANKFICTFEFYK